jgi:hypothetical protein
LVVGPSDLQERVPEQWNQPLRLDFLVGGEIRLKVSCGGTGSVAVTLRAGADETTATASCATTEEEVRAGVGEAALTAAAGVELEVRAEPDEAAQAGGVWLIELAFTTGG